jgi:hypothetical protein
MQTQRIDKRDMSQPQKKGKQLSPVEAAKVKKLSEKLWNKCENGSLVTQKELKRLIKAGADIEWKSPEDATSLSVAALRGHCALCDCCFLLRHIRRPNRKVDRRLFVLLLRRAMSLWLMRSLLPVQIRMSR